MKLKQGFNSAGLHAHYQVELKKQIDDIPVVQAQDQCVLNAGFLSNSQVTIDTGNLCFFKCHVCCESYMNFTSLKTHSKRYHGEIISYRVENVVEARYHKCHICAKILLCDNVFILNPIDRSHSYTRLKNFEHYVVKSGARVFNTFRKYL